MDNKVSETEILYDPMFAKKPPEGWEDSERGGIFGKAVFKKTVFICFLILAIGMSLLLSFRALGKEKYSYKEKENGLMLSEFNGDEKDRVLSVDYSVNKDGTADRSRTVTQVRNYAVCCNEYIEFIIIGRDVTLLEDNCFYYCTNLKAIIVDRDNASYTSVDGVLYNKDMTSIILHPIKNNEYRAALATGLTAPLTENDCYSFIKEFAEVFDEDEENRPDEINAALDETGAYYEIPSSVKSIAPFCFNYCDKLKEVTIPDGVTSIGQMAFFKCTALESISLPDGLEQIGADALSYCESITYIYVPATVKTIGHHAFYGCSGIDSISMGIEDKNEVKTGESWIPKKSSKSLKNVEVLYGQERRDG